MYDIYMALDLADTFLYVYSAIMLYLAYSVLMGTLNAVSLVKRPITNIDALNLSKTFLDWLLFVMLATMEYTFIL